MLCHPSSVCKTLPWFPIPLPRFVDRTAVEEKKIDVSPQTRVMGEPPKKSPKVFLPFFLNLVQWIDYKLQVEVPEVLFRDFVSQ